MDAFKKRERGYMTFVCVSILALLSSCNHDNETDLKPVAKFSINKLYHPGDTIFLNDSSQNAYVWKWVLPDDAIVNTKNAMFIVDPNTPSSQATIKLTVYSQHQQQRDSASSTFNLIPATDFYSDNSASQLYLEEYSQFHGNSLLYAECWTYIGSHKDVSKIIEISFPTQKIVPGIYQLASSTSPGYASIYSTHPQQEALSFTSLSGQLNVASVNNSLVITFDNVPSASYSADSSIPKPTGGTLAGHFTIPNQ